MNAISQLLVAAMAFLGATGAQIISHWLSISRRRAEQTEAAQRYFAALKSDMDYVCVQVVAVLSFFDGIAEDKSEYIFEGDTILLQVHSFAIDRYDPVLPVDPGLVHRARNVFYAISGIFSDLRNSDEIKITHTGRQYIVGYLRYALSLSSRFDRLLAFGGEIDDQAAIGDDDLVEYLFRVSLFRDSRFLEAEQVRYLFSSLAQ